MKYLLVCALTLLLAASLSAQIQKPNFAAITMDGSRIDTASLKGKVIVLNLWFINCPNCRDEIKQLNQIVDQYKDNKDVVFVALAASKKADLEKFLVKNPFKYQVVPSAEMIIFSKFGTANKNGEIDMPFPMHYVLDRSGNVVMKMQGTKGVDAVRAELARQFGSRTTELK
ncbi:MAG: TlpA family protein disulfide reductase [Chloracidobacterium sp.]|nr:TlpA family protein disulfide reductase [Chloracidobacterium sp.]